MKAHFFLITIPNFQLQIHNTWEVITENVLISGIPILILSCIFITASSPVSHSYFAPQVKLRSFEVKLHKMCLRGQGQSVESGKYTCQKWANPPGGPLECQGGYQARPKIHVIRVVFQDQALYAHTLFRGAKTCKTGKKGVFLVI